MTTQSLRSPHEITRIRNYFHSTDSLAVLETQFITQIKELFQFISTLNTFIFETSGVQHLNGIVMMIITSALNQIERGPILDKILSEFRERGLPLIPEIRKNDVDHFAKIAGSLFPEIPEFILTQITGLVKDDLISDAVPDIFESILGVCKTVVTRECFILVKSGVDLNKQEDVLDAALQNLEG